MLTASAEQEKLRTYGTLWTRWQDKNSYGEPAEKRMVAFPADVKYDPSLIAPEWHRWLHRTRVDAPTVEELRQCVPQCH